jgi:hypothetical protein
MCALLVAVAAVVFGAPPASASAAGAAVPVVVDTDMYSSVDDAGAFGVLYGLQAKGEAKVLAVGVESRTSRPTVATNTWKCAAAIDQYYNSGNVPIGSSMPDNGPSSNSPDWITPCAALASSSTPAPENVVDLYRRTLAAQPDGSVTFVSIGYLGNLSALLDSSPDSVSPLSGHDLIAAKVKQLVIMGGGFPSAALENNLGGNPTAAQDVAGNWPTKIVWSGYEVGDNVHNGQSLPSLPANDPVRVSYGAFVTPGNWYYSYDLTAAYHAVRPTDPNLTENGPGTDIISSTGGNTWSPGGSGNQYYLTLGSEPALESSIEGLLDTAPGTDSTPPAISSVAAGSPTGTGTTISWSTDEAADSQVDYGTTSAYGTTTTRNSALGSIHSQALTGLTAGTVYHYRVRSTDAAGNVSVSPDATFTTAAPSGPTLTATPASVAGGATVTVSWQGVTSPTVSDWIGLYSSGADDTAITNWVFTSSCGQSTGSTAAASGSCTMTMPSSNATYQFRLFANNGYTRLAASGPVTVAGSSASTPTLSATPSAVNGGDTVTAAWQGVGSPTTTDWIGLYQQGATDDAAIKWYFTATCTQSSGSAKASGSCPITMPSASGTYEVRLFANNGYTKLATSGPITVGSTSTSTSTPALSASPSTVPGGGTVTVSWQGVGSAANNDWVGLYKQGAADTAFTSWFFTASCGNQIGAPLASGSCSVTVPNSSGTYEFRLFANNSYTKLATSGPVTVSGATISSFISYVGSLSIDPGVAHDLQNKATAAGNQFASGKQHDGCAGLDQIAQSVMDQISQDNPKVGVAQGKGILAQLYALETAVGCIGSSSSLPGAEAAVADMISSFATVSDPGTSHDLRTRAGALGKAAAVHDPATCQRLTDLQNAINAPNAKITSSQKSSFASTLSALKPQVGC